MLVSRPSGSKATGATAIGARLNHGHLLPSLLCSSLQGPNSLTHEQSPYAGLQGPQRLATRPPPLSALLPDAASRASLSTQGGLPSGPLHMPLTLPARLFPPIPTWLPHPFLPTGLCRNGPSCKRLSLTHYRRQLPCPNLNPHCQHHRHSAQQ